MTFQYLASPIIGGLSDRYGRKPLLLMSTVGMILYYSIVTSTVNSLFFQVSHSLTCFGCSPPTSQYLSWLESWVESQKVGSKHYIK